MPGAEWMESVRELALKLSVPLTNLFSPFSRIYWLYLAGALVLAFFAFLAHRLREPAPGRRPERYPFLSFCFPKAIYAHKSAVTDYKYYVVNQLLRSFGLIPLLAVPLVATP